MLPQIRFFKPWLLGGLNEESHGRCLAQCPGDASKHSTGDIYYDYRVAGNVLSAHLILTYIP